MKDYIPCIICGKKAKWSYMPGDENYCDSHVPRGCTCNASLKEGIDPDSEEAKNPESYIEELDEQGRRYPCCEYLEINEDIHNDPEIQYQGWETYYKYNPDKKTNNDIELIADSIEFQNRRSRRTRIKDSMPDQKHEKNARSKNGRKSKPKNFKHNRKRIREIKGKY